jgi:ionotropic kainate glutamate receptor 2
MLNHGKNYTGNNRFYGFSMELLDEIARISKFSYIVDINPDGAYGVKNPVTGEWNGVVKQLMSHVSFDQLHKLQLLLGGRSDKIR